MTAPVVFGHNVKFAGYYDTDVRPANQAGQDFTVPVSGKIARLGAYVGGPYAGYNVTTRLAVWDSTNGNVLGYTSSFLVPNSYPSKHEADLITPVAVTAGQLIRLGFQYDSGYCLDLYVGWQANGAANFYDKSVANGAPRSFASGIAESGDINVYGSVTPGVTVKVRRGGVWVDAEVKVRRGGAWVSPTGIKIRRGGAWHDLA